jgi:hypothetical protein
MLYCQPQASGLSLYAFQSCGDQMFEMADSLGRCIQLPFHCTMPTPSTLQEFGKLFHSWPRECSATRKDPPRPGSSWDIREIETFQIIRKPPKRRIRLLLEPCIGAATAWTEESEDIKSEQNWRACTHQQLGERAGKFAIFFTFLAQVLETPLTSDPRRELRRQYSASLAGLILLSSPLQPPSLFSLPSSPI